MLALLDHARQQRWAQLLAVGLRLALGFAFVPAGLKKLLYQRFTDAANTGPFHEFLHAFYATGVFYQCVGALQLLAAVLLMTQTWATLGALTALPITTAITALCWSTGVIPTATVVSLMWLSTVALIVWDYEAIAPLFRRAGSASHAEEARPAVQGPIDLSVWRRCGAAILTVYAAGCLAFGGVYRPRGIDLSEPAFYVLPLIVCLPVLSFVREQQSRRRAP